MAEPRAILAAIFASVVVIAGVVSGFSVPAGADTTPTQTGAPVTVVIPNLSPTPSPTSSTPGGNGGNSGNNGGGSSGGSGSTPGATNPDGSPVPPGQPKDGASELLLDKERIEANDWMIATGVGFKPGEKVQLVLYPGAVVIGSYVADSSGKFEARFRIPDGTRTGLHVAEATGWQSGFVANGEYTVVSGPYSSTSLNLWWVYVVLGGLALALISLLIAFRADVRRWFGGGVPVPGSTS